MHGARAVQEQAVKAFPSASMSVCVVWTPMLPTDNAWAARRTGRMFTDPRVTQFYDRERRVGTRYMREVFAGCAQNALRALPADHPMHQKLEEFARQRPEQHPLWDAALFYDRGVRWGDTVPAPRFWSKQTSFFGERRDSDDTGVFWHNDCGTQPVDSDWNREVRNAVSQLLKN